MMKVESLYVRNFKGAREIRIAADPTVNEIAGPNEAGKSSTLDAIVAALAGARNIEPEPLRHGAVAGEIEVDLGDIVVKRKFSEKNASRGGSLTIKSKSNGKLGQRDLDALFGDFTFDPLSFSRMRPTDQVEALKRLAGDAFVEKLAALDAEIATAVEDRKEANAALKRIGQVAPPEGDRVAPLDAETVAAELRKAETENRANDRARRAIEQTEEEIANRTRRVAEIREQLLRAEAELKTAKEARADMVEPPPLIDTSELVDRLKQVSTVNARAAAWADYDRRLKVSTEAAQLSNTLDQKVARLREDREEFARSVSLPIPGLKWGTDGVWLDDIPFEQLASSKKLRLSATIGMSVDAKLKIMFVRDGSLLDESSFRELTDLARRECYQLWIETVGSGHSEDAIEIVAGERATPSF